MRDSSVSIRFGVLALLAFTCMRPASRGADDDFGTMRQFDITKYYTQRLNDAGQLDWSLNGERAVSTGVEIHVQQVRITVYRKDGPTTISADACTVDRRTRVVSSSKPVVLRSATMYATGQGFDFDVDRQVLKVRQHVTVRITGRATNLLDETGQ